MSSYPKTWRKSKRRIYAFAACGILLLIAAFFVGTINRTQRVCEFTGTRKYEMTSLGIILSTSYEKSQLEEFIETKYPDALGHKWIYLGTEYQYFLSGARGCSMQPVGVLPTAMSSGMLCDLSDANKKKLYEILVYASANLAQAEKSKRYSTLLDEPPSQVRDFIERFQVPPAKPEATESQTAVEK